MCFDDGQTYNYLRLSAWWSAGQADLGAEPAAYKGPLPGADHAGHGQECPAGVPWPALPTMGLMLIPALLQIGVLFCARPSAALLQVLCVYLLPRVRRRHFSAC